MSIESGKINVFPTALRTQVGTGKFTSEENITGILRAVAHDSYIVSYPDTNLFTGNWEIVIYGYYFKITDGLGIDSGNNVYASIKIDSSGRLVNYSDGSAILDQDSNFTGINISTTNPTETTDSTGASTHVLQLISSGSVCASSLYEINASQVQYNPGSGTTDLQTEVDSLVEYDSGLNTRLTAAETHIGQYSKTDTIADRLDTDESTINTHTTQIRTLNGLVTSQPVLLSGVGSSGNNTMTSSITFASGESSDNEYNDKGIVFQTGKTGIGVKQTSGSGSTMGIRAETGVNIGVGNTTTSTKLSIGSSNTTTYNSIIPDTTETKNLGTSSLKFNEIHGITFDGNSATATESTKLGHTTIGQGPEYSSGVVTSQSMYLATGTPTASVTITFSPNQPSGGSNGDIWFKYVASN